MFSSETSPHLLRIHGEDLFGVNLCTVFGLMLGYPVVYWFDIEKPTNCLSYLPLNVVTATAIISTTSSSLAARHTRCTFTSFSYPAEINSEARSIVAGWWEALRHIGDCLSLENLVEGLEIEETVKTLPAVCL